MNRSSKNRLTDKELILFPSDNLFDKIGRAACRAGCLPRKELFESWEVARRVRRRFRGGRVVDMGCGHGLTAILLLLLDDSSPEALAIDASIPRSADKLLQSYVEEWPRLANRIELCQQRLEKVQLNSTDLVVSVHACGNLTDVVIKQATSARTRLAVLTCCHDLKSADCGALKGWLDGDLAADVVRVSGLQQCGYRVQTSTIPADITPKNRLIIAEPAGDEQPLVGDAP